MCRSCRTVVCVFVCLCVWTSPWKYVKAYRVSTDDWVSERKLIITLYGVFWLSWRSRYSLVLLFSVLWHSRTLYTKHICWPHCPGPSSIPAAESFWQAQNAGNPFTAGLSLSDRETEAPSAENTSVHTESLMPPFKMFFSAHQTVIKCRLPLFN